MHTVLGLVSDSLANQTEKVKIYTSKHTKAAFYKPILQNKLNPLYELKQVIIPIPVMKPNPVMKPDPDQRRRRWFPIS